MLSSLPADHRLSLLLAEQDVLGLVGGDIAGWLAGAFEPVALKVGESLFHEGEQGRFAYLICRGKVRVVRNTTVGALSLGTFGPGCFFGGHADEAHWRRTTSCRAAEDVDLFQLPRAAFDELLALHPHLSVYFDKSVEEAVLLETLGLSQLLASVPADELIPTLDVFGEAAYSRGDVVVREGDVGEMMFVVRTGRLEVRRRMAFAERRLCELQQGDYFGERALVLDQPRAATVVAVEDCTLFSLDRAGLAQLTQTAPSLAMQLKARFDDYAHVVAQAVQAQDVVLIPTRRDRVPLTTDSVTERDAAPAWIEQEALLKLLGLSEFVHGIPPDSVAIVVAALRERRFQPGDILPEGLVFIVRSGEVHAHPADLPGDRPVARFGPGRACGARHRTSPADPWRYTAAVETDGFALDGEALHRLGMRLPSWEPHLRRLAGLEAAADLVELPRMQQLDRSSAVDVSAVKPSQRPIGDPRSKRRAGLRGGRYPWIGQRAENECAVASLAMVARWHNLKLGYDAVREAIDMLPLGTSLHQIRQAAQSLGFDAELVSNLANLSTAPLPAVAHWQESHYIVLFHVGTRSVTVGDPAVGLVRMPRRRFAAHWSGRLLLLSPAVHGRPNDFKTDEASLKTS